MSRLIFTPILGSNVTQKQLEACAQLFTNNYGVWGKKAQEISQYLKDGARVKMSASKLRAQCLASPADSTLVTCHEDDLLVGHVFATTWDYDGGKVCWVTQLVVRSDYRQRGLATVLLGCLLRHEHTAFGLASSHPAACLALCKAARTPIQRVDLAFSQSHAASVIAATPVNYLKSAQLKGTLFEENPTDPAAVSSAFTDFYVKHDEPLEVLKEYESIWPFGALLEGHEFFVLVKVQPRMGTSA